MKNVIRVLLVDDSPTARAVVRRILLRDAGFEIAGEAGNGSEGVEAAERLAPDVIVMDLDMPVLDGFEATQRIVAQGSTPVVVLSSAASGANRTVVFQALRAGAAEVLAKPEDAAGWQELATSLPTLLRNLHHRPAALEPVATPPAPRGAVGSRWTPLLYLAVGASTGGPNAIRRMLVGLEPDRTLAVLVVQHIAKGFEKGLAEWLKSETRRDVRLARDGESVAPGVVYLAPAEAHLRLAARGRLELDTETPARGGHRPSADELFSSCARQAAVETVGVLLTGMGADGADGLAELAREGGRTLVQDEESSMIFGMPLAALLRGAAQTALPPEQIGSTIASWTRKEAR